MRCRCSCAARHQISLFSNVSVARQELRNRRISICRIPNRSGFAIEVDGHWPARALKKKSIPFNPEGCLRLARSGVVALSSEVADQLENDLRQKIRDWTTASDSRGATNGPSSSLLANPYERPFLEFLRRSLPSVQEPQLVPDFRRPRDAKKLSPDQERDLKSIQSWAEAQRDNALDLYTEIGEDPPTLP